MKAFDDSANTTTSSDRTEIANGEDPLQASLPEVVSSKATSSIEYDTPEQLLEIVSRCEQVDLTAEEMDPLEWTVRKVVSIPQHYYWDVLQHPDERSQIPSRIRWWHHSIFHLARSWQWTENTIGKPLIQGLGLNNPRVSEVTMFMTDEDWNKSQRIVTERRRKQRQSAADELSTTTEQQDENTLADSSVREEDSSAV